ncbi:MAG: mandelate racemase/muconate lactonizing protein [Candidatus Buchananbacteria bacterium CG10_big_fil_rev_8_21_14_0_10_42_9]|uniref:Mandelate racemase/muconate lactonizing protein n=1 Tax=Candidatus Buchananbacteria bacterium CG10_big_fil_rev_8_21_14_0_10_42_9 TaxID=1974526 RepID=A0A2H0W1R4_9BACT|nr:MAG: mandelate racemase/muconate lactonizing protein [Candidatus Buchananbacteria bacterium CG10_big_fil_rev_8_21_14_0_10_42_9]
MKIENVEFLKCDAGWRQWLFIKITTNTGLTGYSECTDSHGSPSGIAGVVSDLKPRLIGKNPLAFEAIYWELYAATRQSVGSIIQKAIGGIENALLDIVGKHHNVRVCDLFGGPIRDTIPVYWSHWGTTRVRAADKVGVPQLKGLDDVAKFVSQTKAMGFNTIKTNIACFKPEPHIYMPGFNGPAELNYSQTLLNDLEQYVKTIRSAGGDEFGIIVDLNYNFKTDGYKKVAKVLEPYNLTWLEIDSYDAKALAQIKEHTTTPICSGENLYGVRQYKPYLENYSMDFASIDVIWNGFVQSKKISDLAEVYEMNITPHNYYSHLATFISAQFAALVPNLKTLEVDVDDVPWKDELTSAKPEINQGILTLNDKPGWGCDINEDVLKAHPVS